MNKFTQFLFAVLFAFIIYGCETVVAPPETINPVPSSNGQIMMKVTAAGSQSVLLSGGKIDIAVNTALVLEAATTDTSLLIKTWQWVLPNGSAFGKYAAYTPTVGAGSSIQIKLTGTDYNNQTHEVIITVNVIWNINGTNLVYLSSVVMGADGKGTITFYLSTERIKKQVSLQGYFIKGTVNNWIRAYVQNSDESYSLINGVFTPDPKGLYLKAVVNHSPGDHKFGLGKMKNATEELWEDFKGSPYTDSTDWTLLKYNLSSTGVVTPGGTGIVTPPSIPGLIDDQGNPWVIVLTPNNNIIKIYVNNGVNFTSGHPFVAFRSASGNYNTKNVAEVAVTGFPTAGSVQINYSDTLEKKMVAFKLGGDMVNYPSVYDTTLMKKSKLFYNEDFGDIRFIICPPVLAKSNGSNSSGQWTIRPVVKGIDY